MNANFSWGVTFPLFSRYERTISKRFTGKNQDLHSGVYTGLSSADGSVCPIDMIVTMVPWDKDKAVLVSLRDITECVQVEEERERLIFQLKETLAKVKVLSGFLPICVSCKKVRDDQGYWN